MRRDPPLLRPASVCALALLLALPASASAASAGLSASSLELSGAISSEGRLRAFALLDPAASPLDTQARPLPDPGFTLVAERVTLETATQDNSLPAGAPDGLASARTESRDFAGVQVAGTEDRRGYALAVFPVPGRPDPTWSSAGSCASMRPGQSSVYRPGTPAASQSVDVAGSVLWTDCAPAAWGVRGDFELVLWQWDGELTAGGRTEAFWSGKQPLPAAAQPLGQPAVGPERRLAFHVTGGELRLPAFLGADLAVYLLEPEVRMTGRALLSHAVGFVAATGQHAQGEAAEAVGQLVLAAGIASERIPLRLEASGASTAALQASDPITVPLAWAWWAVAALLALAVVVALVARRRSLLPRRVTPSMQEEAWSLFGHAETLVYEGRFRKARRLLDRAIRLDGTRPDFFALRARCRTALGDLRRAMRDHRQAHDGFPRIDSASKASNALEAARASSLSGLRDQAMAWLGLASRYDPSVVEDARDMPELVALVGAPNRARRPA